ncbi:hypothetical protein [Sporomusa acidovorans]|uniref:Phosphoglucosamine mutase n=1 Tax=Sporomusa acidovorans (strain ATCC 49682 / DSM 3132 / Mol) TaxID=1123286 RepID=A0ABZ3JCA8_SPOA4|nr:hypothetical protein [Sporomusa acidovorans]OZC13229.1 phosphoglucosamine mutase [Sporomusa acidovorans DSM 3132]SDE00421.1 Phosphoglucomutase/phosphomannomutase, C-terminal domain [Sporomusa acidovorans]
MENTGKGRQYHRPLAFPGRRDLHLADRQKRALLASLALTPPASIGTSKVLSVQCTDGCKLELESGWLIFRASGTEPIIRIYAELSTNTELESVLAGAIEFAQSM